MTKWIVIAVLIGVLSFVMIPNPADPVDSVVLVYNAYGHGSGSIVGPSTVLTAKHVAQYEGLMIRTADGDEYKVVTVKEDPDSDLAILVIDGVFDEKPLTLDRTPLKVGDEITAIGTPLGHELFGTVLTGTVIKVDAVPPIYGYVNMDGYDAHVTSGCSGSPILDKNGHIRAVHVLGFGPYGFGVPVEELDVE